MSAGAMDWRIDGIYDSIDQVIEMIREDWGLSESECNDKNISQVLRNADMKVEYGTYHQSKQVQRDEKIEELIGGTDLFNDMMSGKVTIDDVNKTLVSESGLIHASALLLNEMINGQKEEEIDKATKYRIAVYNTIVERRK